jgi:hypothetical protein
MATAATALFGESEMIRFRRMTVILGITVLLLLPVLTLLGYFMRLFQSGAFPKVRPEWFYAALTLHSVGMVGTWFVGSMAGVSYLLLKYTRPSLAISRFTYWGTLLGVVLLIVCTLGGLFGTGWYFLYPLPLMSQHVWQPWATLVFFHCAGHSRRLLDHLDIRHSALDRSALLTGRGSRVELYFWKARPGSSAAGVDHDREPDRWSGGFRCRCYCNCVICRPGAGGEC